MKMVSLTRLLFLSSIFFAQIIPITWAAATPKIEEEAEPASCHPTPESLSSVYILGYGSLLNSPSKSKSYPGTGINIPVNVTGFSRNWNCKGQPVGHSTTYLGVDRGDATTTFNGVVFKLPDLQSLLSFDKREIYYCRKLVPRSDIRFLIDKQWNATVEMDWPPEDAQFWIYEAIPKYVAWPSARYPIVQTYVDVYLGGCLEMEETYNLTGYADLCINSTQGWEYPWINDRLIPRRPFVNTPRAFKIDNLIHKHFPRHFEQSQIEQEIRYNFNTGGGKSGGCRCADGNSFYLHLVFGSILGSLNLYRSVY